MTIFKTLLRDRRGATAIEYALIAALIGAAMVTGLQSASAEISNTMNVAGNAMSTQNAAA
ncbi:Flp family type IVb pilin [Novosphingobium sp.]|uniref:Flp family type IVb pilin n=1 Tax=Novosphingobium sp. TaxID=1874826 RepID=UPI0035B16D99